MASTRQILAARANGAKSCGPKTLEGKRRSSLNAMRHGLLTKIVVLPNESSDGFQKLIALHEQRFGLSDGVEFGMIEEMASAYWRMRRAWNIERALFTETIRNSDKLVADGSDRTAAAFSLLADSPKLALLYRYETRLHNMYQRALNNILLLRALGPDPESDPEPDPEPEPDSLYPDPDSTPNLPAADLPPAAIYPQSAPPVSPAPPPCDMPAAAANLELPNEPNPASGHSSSRRSRHLARANPRPCASHPKLPFPPRRRNLFGRREYSGM